MSKKSNSALPSHGPRAYSYVRFSTPEQAKGRSLKRQIEKAEAWSKEHGIPLDHSLRMQDLGMSGFHGSHKTKGGLGRFLAAVDADRVPPGSYLLVENLDRLTREDLDEAHDLFKRILKKDVSIVTLTDGRLYTKESLKDLPQLFGSLMIMARAHEESARKQGHLKDAWAAKRKSLESNSIITARCPAWLRPKGRTWNGRHLSGGEWELIPDRVSTIRRIFTLYAQDGNGASRICQIFNKEQVPTFGRSKGWQVSSIKKLLHNRALLGEFQPHIMKDGKRVPEGSPIPNYFPAIISHELFERVQSRLRMNDKAGGKKGDHFGNLFTGMAKCFNCGGSMVHVVKNKAKGEVYLVCDSARRGLVDDSGHHLCKYKSLRYSDFESRLLVCLRDHIDLRDVLPASDIQEASIRNLAATISGLDSQLRDCEAARKQVHHFIERAGVLSDDNIASFKVRLEELSEQRTSLLKVKKEKAHELDNLTRSRQSANQTLENMQALVNRFTAPEVNDEIHALRRRLHTYLMEIIKEIRVISEGKTVQIHFRHNPGNVRIVPLAPVDPEAAKQLQLQIVRKYAPDARLVETDGKVRIVFELPEESKPSN